MWKKLFRYSNPLAQLGSGKYSFFFPFFFNILLLVLSEIYAYKIAKNPNVVGNYIIFLNVASIIYFSFRDGVLGGLTTTILTIIYYAYVIYTRHYSGNMLAAGIDTTINLAIIYLFLSGVIGFLKVSIDRLIEREADGRRRLVEILDQLPVGVIISNSSGKVEFINKQIKNLFTDNVRVGDTLGKNMLHIFNGNAKPVKKNDSPTLQVLKSGKATKTKEFIVTRSDGSKLYTRSRAAPIKNKKGEIIAIASIASDITAQKELEQRKDTFIDMVSHEFKTPLTSVKVFNHVLQKQLKSKKYVDAKELAKRIDKQLSKLGSLVSNLLDITRMQKGKMNIAAKKFYVRELAEEVIDDLKPISKHELVLQWTTRLPVSGDKERLRQVLTNLVTNAIKYSPENKKIIIGSRGRKKFLEIYVKDFGMGIPKHEQKKIFTRFYQVSKNSTYPGLGLGLYISTLIIKQHHGKMWVESEEGKGSTFWFSLPIYKK